MVAQEVCIPEDPYCGQDPNSSSPPDLSVQDTVVVVEEGQTAYSAGAYDDTFDVDQAESVTLSASAGTVRSWGTERGQWEWQMPTDRYGPYQPAGAREHQITITATDSTGRSTSATFTLMVNPVPPTVELTRPFQEVAVNGVTMLAAEAQDNVGIDRVYFFVNGEYAGRDSEAPYELSWDSTTVPDGTTKIVARAYDLSDNTAESVRSVIVDNTVPQAPRVLDPQEGARTAGTFSLRGYAEPGSNVEVFEGTESLGRATADKYALWRFPLTGVAEGTHVYHAVATDRAGNVSAASDSRKVVVDTTRPTIISVTPPEGAKRVAAAANITSIFSETMRTRSIDRTTVVLVRKGSTTPLPTTVTYDAIRKKVILDPDRKLVQGATYIATINGGTRGVKDLAGNTLTRSKVWSFQTR